MNCYEFPSWASWVPMAVLATMFFACAASAVFYGINEGPVGAWVWGVASLFPLGGFVAIWWLS